MFRSTTSGGKRYAHKQSYIKQSEIDRPRARLNHSERLIKGVYMGSYQALADTLRSDTFTANLPWHSVDETRDYIDRYILSAHDRALEGFTRVIASVVGQGVMTKASSSTAQQQPYQYIPPSPGATITPMYPGSIPKWVPPRRKLLRIPRRRIVLMPGRRDFSSAPQVHLDAVAALPLDLVTLIDQGQKDGIIAALDMAIRRGDGPDRLGMIVANMVGLFPRWQQAVVNLGDRMAEDGKSQKEIDYRMGRYSDWLRERRGIMIARTEMITALNVGRIAGWKQQAEQGLLDTSLSSKEWSSAPDACPVCKELNGTVVQGVDGVFDAGEFGKVQHPPCHPHCRCSVLLHPVRRPDQYLES